MNSVHGVDDFMMRIEAFNGKALFAVESTANLWLRLYYFLDDNGMRVVLSSLYNTRLERRG